MPLLETVSKFIEKERLFLSSDKLLCAVSGGKDSMAMLDLLRSMGYNVMVGHVNYMLRGEDSILDEALVSDYCSQHRIPFFSRRLTIEETSDLKKSNLQEKAREIRYNWLTSLMTAQSGVYLLTAHHLMDNAETFLLHSLRGAGIKGLRAIQATTGMVRRPLLSSSSQEISEYVTAREVPYREDRSNQSDEYDRNYIRHQVFQVLSDRWPQCIESMAKSVTHLSAEYNLLQSLVDKETKKWVQVKDNEYRLGPLSEFRTTDQAAMLGYHMISTFGFSHDSIQLMICDEHSSGAVFYSTSHEALIDRDYLVIHERADTTPSPICIESLGAYASPLGTLQVIANGGLEKNTDRLIEYIDAAKVSWPLTLRAWESGDFIYPMGMEGRRKKVSDILIDQKVSLFEKRKQLVLCNQTGEIVWVVGLKLSEHFKCEDTTTSFLKISWTKEANQH